jgi:hypothetical protein
MKKGRVLFGLFAAVVFMFALNLTTQANNNVISSNDATVEFTDVIQAGVSDYASVSDQDPPKKAGKKAEKSEECTTKTKSECCGETKAKSSECETEKKTTKKKVG